jgi:carbonic anhydrase/acetyltransferase-like protein (isoleucine patch superfamily)
MIVGFEGELPELGPGAFVAPTATVLGKVALGPAASVWYGCVLRGDVGRIRVGARSNIQDLTVVHVTGGKLDTAIGSDVTVGHRVILHGCTVGDRVLVGMGAILLDGVEIGDDCIVGAGALVTPGTKVPTGSLVLGAPAKVARPLEEAERRGLVEQAARYVELAGRHRALG